MEETFVEWYMQRYGPITSWTVEIAKLKAVWDHQQEKIIASKPRVARRAKDPKEPKQRLFRVYFRPEGYTYRSKTIMWAKSVSHCRELFKRKNVDKLGVIVRIDSPLGWEVVWRLGDIGGMYDEHSRIDNHEEWLETEE